MTVALPSFESAVAELAAHASVAVGNMRWIFRRDVLLHNRVILITDSVDGEGVARRRYARATAVATPGVELIAVGMDFDVVYCTINAPRSAADAEQRMLRGLKLRVLAPLLQVCVVDVDTWRKRAAGQTSSEREFLDDLFVSEAG